MLPLNIQKRWNLPKGEYIVFYPEYDEALQAMGFPPTYFSGFKMSTMERSKAEQLGKTTMIGNSWHVTIIKLLVEWYCRTNGWIKS